VFDTSEIIEKTHNIFNKKLSQAIHDHQIYDHDILYLNFTDIHQYLKGIEEISKKLHEVYKKSSGKIKSISYLCAAVSDFYIPLEEMPDHKIQSREVGDGFDIKTIPVPKKLGAIKKEWNPNTYCVSFKLETDLSILKSKSMSAINNYNMDLVVAN
jgi:phosphopantothenate-cysteine ligase